MTRVEAIGINSADAPGQVHLTVRSLPSTGRLTRLSVSGTMVRRGEASNIPTDWIRVGWVRHDWSFVFGGIDTISAWALETFTSHAAPEGQWQLPVVAIGERFEVVVMRALPRAAYKLEAWIDD